MHRQSPPSSMPAFVGALDGFALVSAREIALDDD